MGWREEGKRYNSLPALGRVLFCIQHSQLRIKRKCISGAKALLPGALPLGSCGSECEESIFYKEIVWLGKITVGKVRGKLWGFREVFG